MPWEAQRTVLAAGCSGLLSRSWLLAGWHRATWRNQVGMDASVDPEADCDGGVWDFLN